MGEIVIRSFSQSVSRFVSSSECLACARSCCLILMTTMIDDDQDDDDKLVSLTRVGRDNNLSTLHCIYVSTWYQSVGAVSVEQTSREK